MSLKPDAWIRSKCLGLNDDQVPMIEPFYENLRKEAQGRALPSFGLSSYGYDVRLGNSFTFAPRTEVGLGNYAGPSNVVCMHHNGSVKRHMLPNANRNLIIDLDGNSTDTNRMQPSDYVTIDDVEYIDLPPGAFVLGVTMELIALPRDVTVVCMGKSTVARAGVIVTVTPLEAGWEGYVTLEITNTNSVPVRLYSGMGITQLQFYHHADEQCEVSYADRKGKYMGQEYKPVTARL